MKFVRIAIISLLAITALLGSAALAGSVDFEVTVRELTDDGEYILIARQPLTIRENIRTSSFITNFTLDLEASYSDSGVIQCEFTLFTVGPQSQTKYKKFQSYPGGIYFVNDVRVKNGVVFRVGISPLQYHEADANSDVCDYDYRKDGVWKYDPSANIDLYYVPRTLGDARWNLARDYIEINYKDFKKTLNPTFPGKVNVFLAPCVLPEVTWDLRSGYAIDPNRFNCFMLYSHNHNTIDPFPVFLVRLYRYMGYAPPILTEGLAGYYDYPHFYASKLKRGNKLPALGTMLTSIDYYDQKGHDNITAASSFANYMVKTYGYNKYENLYQKSTDLTIRQGFKSVYEKSLETLEQEWHEVLDTFTININHVRYYYERDEYIYNKSGMDNFLQEFKQLATTDKDTLYALNKESWSQYMDGEYFAARGLYEQLIVKEPNNSNHSMVYGNLLLIDGQYDSAIAVYSDLIKRDTTIKTALYKRGEAYYWQGNKDSAQYYFDRDLTDNPSPLSKASAGIFMGMISLTAGDTSLARDYYAGALEEAERIYQYGRSKPGYLLRLGQAHMGLAMCDNLPFNTARSFLDQARYFEIHPKRIIFLTRILQELGRIADLEGNRDEAISLYQEAMEYPLPPFMDNTIREYIAKPFTGYTPQK